MADLSSRIALISAEVMSICLTMNTMASLLSTPPTLMVFSIASGEEGDGSLFEAINSILAYGLLNGVDEKNYHKDRQTSEQAIDIRIIENVSAYSRRFLIKLHGKLKIEQAIQD